MSEELPSINDFIEDKSNLPSVKQFIEGALPIQESFEEKKKEIVSEDNVPQVVREQPDNTALIVSLIENVRNSIPEVKSYDRELFEIVNLIEQLKRDIDDSKVQKTTIMESNGYDKDVLREELNDIRNSIPTVPEVRYYDEEIKQLQEAVKKDNDHTDDIKHLQESVRDVKNRSNVDHSWISSTFNSIDENYNTLSTSLATFKGKLDMDVKDILESMETVSFEDKVDKTNLNKRIDETQKEFFEATDSIASNVVEFKDNIYKELKEASLRIWTLQREYKDNEVELKKHVKEQYEILKESISQVLSESDSNYDRVTKYFDNLKEDVRLLPESFPEVKYYDSEIEQVNESVKKVDQSVKSVQNLVEVLENKLNKKIAGLKESILVVPPTENNTDPLTPLDQNFATLDDLSNHYRLFLNRIQQQLATLGGGGETRLEFLDDVDRDTALVDGKFLKYQASTGTFVGADGGGGGGISVVGTAGSIIQHNGTEFVGVTSVGLGTFFNDHHQGYYRYTTHFYSSGIANTTQTLPADAFELIQPAVRTNKVDFMPQKMLDANSNDPWIGAGATIGTGQTEFSLAGTDAGSSVIVRIAAQFNPDIDNTNVDFALNFTTNPTTQGFGVTNFSVVREQALICNEGADQNYISETLINFYVGDDLSGDTKATAGSFNISARASDEGEFEMMALTINVVT